MGCSAWHRSAGQQLEESDVPSDVHTQIDGDGLMERSYAAASRRVTAGEDAP